MEEHYGIVPPTGVHGQDWPSGITPTLPQGIHGELSKGGWSKGNEGFVQQTFLGASISNFNISAGFGSSSTTLSVSLVNDEYNKSDETGLGQGDDVYHNGREDFFRPPVVGSPVYFKFGKNHATLDQAYRRTYNVIYGSENPTSVTLKEETIKGPINSIPENYFLKEERPISQDEEEETIWEDQTPIKDPSYDFRGYNHFVFGGILANYTKDEGSSRTFSASVADPREILSNVQVILNDYQGTVFNNKNILNVYGFLEYDRSKALENQMDANAFSKNLITRDANGFLIGGLPNPLTGEPTADCYLFEHSTLRQIIENDPNIRHLFNQDALLKNPCLTGDDFSSIHNIFPVTGQGMSRRCNQGIPWYRVYQALKSMMYWTGYDFGFAPCEYTSAGFGGVVDFRGFNYVVDLSGLPLHKIPQMYFLDTDQIDLLSLIQDVCQTISHDYVVSLLPVLDSPRTRMLYQYNKSCVEEERFGDIVTGIIRVDAIDKTVQPQYGTVTKYIENLEENGAEVETKNIGFETTNVTTDRFIVGHQEVNMYVFTGSAAGTEHELEDNLRDQIVPFFGFVDKNEEVVTIPKGYGPFKQIVLNTEMLDAFGVGDYYVATELELRAAEVSFEQWAKFLSYFDDKYVEINKQGTGVLGTYTRKTPQGVIPEVRVSKVTPDKKAMEYFLGYHFMNADLSGLGVVDTAREGWINSNKYAVVVPRCLWPSERNYSFQFGEPASQCSPPYGYPLYFGRATAIGINHDDSINILRTLKKMPQIRDNLNFLLQNQFTGNHITLSQLANKLKNNGAFAGDGTIQNIELVDVLEKTWKNKYPMGANFVLSREAKAWANGGLPDRPANTGDEKRQKFAYEIMEIKKLPPLAPASDLINNIVKKFLNTHKVERRNGNITANVSWLLNQGEENARKVHEFLSGVASKHLGKTYLVKIPKSANLNYLPNRIVDTSFDVTNVHVFPFRPPRDPSVVYDAGLGTKGVYVYAGPFGFPPVAVNGRAYQPVPSIFNRNFAYLDADYDNSNFSWSNGALRCNYNPINKNWEYNYKPEPAGGYFSVNLWSGTAERLNIYPSESQPFEENGRISAYVRYDYSQGANFEEIDPENISKTFTNTVMTVDDFPYRRTDHGEPEIIINPSTGLRTTKPLRENLSSYTFVKVDLSDKLYHTPRVIKRRTKVFGDGLTYRGTNTQLANDIINGVTIALAPGEAGVEFSDKAEPILDARAGYLGSDVIVTDFERSFRGSEPFDETVYDENGRRHLQPALGPPEKFLIKREYLSTDHIYALITLPGKVTQGIEDGGLPKVGSRKELSVMCFVSTQVVPNSVTGFGMHPVKSAEVDGAVAISKNASTETIMGLSNPEQSVTFQSPPVLAPQVAVLPLLSHERCYGPWTSASKIDNNQERYSDIGGKVEYVKDEHLSPWNYGGYGELQQAGILKAQFSNSLLLFGEKGSFTFPGAPAGLTIATPLMNARGPLVTSINVNVGDSVKTTVSMDSFSPNFGKLKKQQEEQLADLAKERRRMIDDRNRAIRDSKSKSQGTRFRIQQTGSFKFGVVGNSLYKNNTAQTVLSASSFKTSGELEPDEEVLSNFLSLPQDASSSESYFNSASLTDNKGFINLSQGLFSNINERNKMLKKTGMENLNNFIVPFDHQPDNPNMANFDYISKYSIDRRTN